MKSINASNYKKCRFYPAIARAVAAILETNTVVTPIEVLLRLQRITKQQHEDWRFGRISYLERVCVGNLSKLSVILRVLDHHARAIGLKPSQTVYHKWGRRGRHIILRFSKSGAPALEAAYSRHYVAKGRPGPVGETAATSPGPAPAAAHQPDTPQFDTMSAGGSPC
jgi:hypothetical protein